MPHDDAHLVMDHDGGLTGAREQAVRLLLYLSERDYCLQLPRDG